MYNIGNVPWYLKTVFDFIKLEFIGTILMSPIAKTDINTNADYLN